MRERFDKDVRRAIRLELARQSYATSQVRLAATELSGFRWLVTTHRGLFAVSTERTSLVLHSGKAPEPRQSEIVWLDRHRRVIAGHELPASPADAVTLG